MKQAKTDVDAEPGSTGGDVVIPVLVTGIHPTTNAGAWGEMDPGNKCRDDTVTIAWA
jgi:hypothetical protein